MKIILKDSFKPSITMLITLMCLFFISASCDNEKLFEELLVEEDIIEEEEAEDESNSEDEDIPLEDFVLTLMDDNYFTAENTPILLTPYENDGELPEDVITTFSSPLNGTLTTEGSIEYMPNNEYFGEDSIEYTICDVTGETCFSAVILITIEEEVQVEDEFASELKAFPSAYGGGGYASGGRGGNVYHVTNLNDDGSSGTFRWALGQPRPATIVFDVSGIIELQSTLNINGTDLTIAGQSAPEGGITITGSRFKGQDANNIVMRYLRIRPLKSGNDAFEFYGNNSGAYNIILDHISLSYGGDETLSLRGTKTHNVTFQRILIAEGKTGSLFGDSNTPSKSYDNSFLNSLFFNISHRQPNVASDGRVDVINNVVHDWQYRLSTAKGDIKLNHIGNYYSMGSRTGLIGSGGSTYLNLNMAHPSYNQEIYSSGNIVNKDMFSNPNADNKALWAEFKTGYADFAKSEQFVGTEYSLIQPKLTVKSAEDAYSDVIGNVGANASINADGSVTYYTDVQDSFYLDVMKRGTYHPYRMSGSDVRSWFDEAMYNNYVASISSTPINSRSENYDTDRDGMPDVWERMYGTNPDLADNNGDKDGDGYTNLEEFLNSVDKV